MKCHWCAADIRLPQGAPGTYFLLGIGSAVVAVLALVLGLLLDDGGMQVPTFIVSCIAAASAVMSGVGVWTALIDNRSMAPHGLAEPGRRCDTCGGVTPLKPWSR
jgi:hypothetical protein